jgi:hypothetical protein
MKAPARGGLHAGIREGKLLRLPLENRSGVDTRSMSEQSSALIRSVKVFFEALRTGPFDRRKDDDPNYAGVERRLAA